MNVERLQQLSNWALFEETVSRYGSKLALEAKQGADWQRMTYAEWYAKSLHLAAQLHQAGLMAGDRVLIVSANIPEWYVLDMALSRLGLINISLFPNYAPEDYQHILQDAQPAAIFVGDALLLSLLRPALKEVNVHMLRYSIRSIEDFMDWSELMKGTAKSGDLPEAPGPEAVYSIFYTSGTGGKPKGVIMPYRGISAAAVSMGRALGLVPGDRAISFLSVSHAYERGHYLSYVAFGCSLTLADPGSSPTHNLNRSAATVMTSVPLLLQRIVDGFSVAQESAKAKVALEAAFRYDPGQALCSPSPDFREQYASWKAALGQHLRVLSCAGAPLNERIARFFWAIGIPLQEVYGLSECFSVTYARPEAGVKLGTVGPVAEFAEVRLDDDGEVLFRGPFLMTGFYNLPELTRRVIDEQGWFHTGDLGVWVENRYLRLIGRKKDQFKIASGHYVHPGTIEARLMEASGIDQALVFEREGRLEAIVQPAESLLRGHALRRGENDHEILHLLNQEVGRVYNHSVLEPEQIVRLHLAKKEWGILSGELTPSMKVKRQTVLESILT